MLDLFTVSRTFHKARVTVHVDCVRKAADMLMVYDRRICRMGEVPFHEVRSPEDAERYLSRTRSERGTLVEQLEWEGRHGI